MIADVADYSEWRNNRRATAIIFSAMMVGLKGGLSIGGALVASILGYYGYEPGIEQTTGTLYGIKMLISVFPSVPFIFCVLLLFFYEIDKKMESKIEMDLKIKR
jgi:Na+/melibiose symporter-like transporter